MIDFILKDVLIILMMMMNETIGKMKEMIKELELNIVSCARGKISLF